MIYGDVEKRVMYLYGNVDNCSVGELSKTLLEIIEKDNECDLKEKNYHRRPVCLYINSYGGGLHDAWGLIDIILNSPTPVYTYCTGYAMSAGFLILIAGHKRFASEHSIMMYHQFTEGMFGTYQDNCESQKLAHKVMKTMEDYVISRTKFSRILLKEIREKKLDYYIYPKEALNLGVIDNILSKEEKEYGFKV